MRRNRCCNLEPGLKGRQRWRRDDDWQRPTGRESSSCGEERTSTPSTLVGRCRRFASTSPVRAEDRTEEAQTWCREDQCLRQRAVGVQSISTAHYVELDWVVHYSHVSRKLSDQYALRVGYISRFGKTHISPWHNTHIKHNVVPLNSG